MAQQRPHVPKFGNFESENDIPYTAYFEKARNDKGTGVRMNPNDPEENPEAFIFAKKENKSRNDNFSQNHRRDNSRSVVSESESESISDNFVNINKGNNNWKKVTTESEYCVPPSPGTDRHRNTSNVSDMSYASASVPKFGAWDEKDPASGEGFTVIFNKVKEEKQIAASKFPLVPPQVVTQTKAHKEINNKSKSKMCFKKWCCLSSREKDY